MSKIVIFEGLDNCFKSTNVNELFNYWARNDITSHKLHYSGIKINESKKSKKMSMLMYDEMFKLFGLCFNENINLIVDRSHLGENVYSYYRNYNPSYIWDLESKYKKYKFWNSIYLIYMKDNDIESIINRDDGKSLSISYTNKEYEQYKFNEAFEKSQINHKISINVTNKSKEQIFVEILNFLGK